MVGSPREAAIPLSYSSSLRPPLIDSQTIHRFYHPSRVQFFAFVDDTYIIVNSPSWTKNCELLQKAHEHLLSWANDNHVTFAPDKYGLLHFMGPGEAMSESAPRNRPNIADLPPDDVLFEKPYLVILGVRVDNRLAWTHHVELIHTKVEKAAEASALHLGLYLGPNPAPNGFSSTSHSWSQSSHMPPQPGSSPMSQSNAKATLARLFYRSWTGFRADCCNASPGHLSIPQEMCFGKSSTSRCCRTSCR